MLLHWLKIITNNYARMTKIISCKGIKNTNVWQLKKKRIEILRTLRIHLNYKGYLQNQIGKNRKIYTRLFCKKTIVRFIERLLIFHCLKTFIKILCFICKSTEKVKTHRLVVVIIHLLINTVQRVYNTIIKEFITAIFILTLLYSDFYKWIMGFFRQK